MSKPLITIITSTLNVEMEIPNLINSLLIQKYQNFEWLIIDGGSSDNTLEKLNCISKANLICSAKDSGIYDAWNKGLKFAKGEWVIFLGADDELYDENVFKNFYNFTRNISKDIEIIYGKVFSNSQIFGKEINNLKEEIVKYMCICHQATFHRNTLFKKLGFFNPNYKIGGDYEFLIRSIVKHNKFGIFYDELVSIMGENGISSNKKNGLFIAIEMFNSRVENDVFPITLKWIRHLIAGFYYKFLSILDKIILILKKIIRYLF